MNSVQLLKRFRLGFSSLMLKIPLRVLLQGSVMYRFFKASTSLGFLQGSAGPLRVKRSLN